jgi:undecaprenyl phosphate-alpha-L-ara4FN deformylase
VTLPTYDEIIGRRGITNGNYNAYLLSLLRPARLNVLTIHAEVEGMACLGLFDLFIREALSRGITLVPLGALLEHDPAVGRGVIIPAEVPGREGWVACQGPLRSGSRSEAGG